MLEILFWTIFALIIYSYIGYPLIAWFISLFCKKNKFELPKTELYPTLTLFIAAFNEEDFVKQKMENSLALNYPKDKIKIVWVTDGSDDNTNILLKEYPEAIVYFQPERNGKIHAMNRGMDFVDTDIVVFSDGNTTLGKNTLIKIIQEFENPKIGCVAGEKRVISTDKDDAASSGESIYWKYESWLKQKDSCIGSCIGAAGELFAIRKKLFHEVPSNAILDDFMLSINLAMKGYKVAYNKEAFATERASANINEEMKRKTRIAAGSIQSFIWLLPLLNIFKYGVLSFQYISHKVFRWIIVPILMPTLVVINLLLAYRYKEVSINIYSIILALQAIFYFTVLFGRLLQSKKIRLRVLFVPYYFFMANWAMWIGFFKYIKGSQSVNWERAKRAV